MTSRSRRTFIKSAVAGAAATMVTAHSDVHAQSQNSDLTGLSLSAASQFVRSKKTSPVELTKACLGRIWQVGTPFGAIGKG